MEDALRETFYAEMSKNEAVLILIVMEDALRACINSNSIFSCTS